MMKRAPSRLLLAAAFAIVAKAADACPYCDSEVGKAVSAGIFNGDFATNAVATLFPLAILLTIVWLIHSGFPPLDEVFGIVGRNTMRSNSKHPSIRGTDHDK
ncbi:putative secreted protein [Rhodopirellula maiorica SM1]|uniref:Putative secreted protein n=1 Tax=Rhodopirellula maiorica SM1 TaxID=1265738 RepID=M5RT31_9BACT|nr:hypothetical protein [Rhodopirellula maiorica]EMI22498.1 putative secreted protein [Rhodopirellula maiorica SM1]